MPKTATPTITAEDLLTRYAADIGFVAEAETPAADLRVLSHHLETAASNFEMAGINGHEDVDRASDYIHEAYVHESHPSGGCADRDVFLRKADQLLRPIVSDMVQEYRCIVGD